MTKPVLHVVFGASAAGSLRVALGRTGRNERIVHSYDDFSFGPINPPDAETRIRWVEEELGVIDWDDVAAATESFLAESLSPEVRPVAWISRRDTHAYTGFLYWLWQLREAPCEIIDVTELMIARTGRNGEKRPPELVVSPSLLLPDEMVELLDHSTPLSSTDRHQYLTLWQRLVQENAPLRVINETGLVSAPITFFDELLLSFADHRWQKMARVVAYAMGQSWEGSLWQTGDLLLGARVRALAHAGALEWKGDLTEMRYCEVRLPERDTPET